MGKLKKIVFIACVLVLVMGITVVGVLAITSGTQTTSFSISYTVRSIQARITWTVSDGSAIAVPISDAVANIEVGDTSSTITPPTINNNEAIPFALNPLDNSPYDITFAVLIEATGSAVFSTVLSVAPIMDNCTMAIKTGLTVASATTTYQAQSTHAKALTTSVGEDYELSRAYVITFSVTSDSSNASASGNFILALERV